MLGLVSTKLVINIAEISHVDSVEMEELGERLMVTWYIISPLQLLHNLRELGIDKEVS